MKGRKPFLLLWQMLREIVIVIVIVIVTEIVIMLLAMIATTLILVVVVAVEIVVVVVEILGQILRGRTNKREEDRKMHKILSSTYPLPLPTQRTLLRLSSTSTMKPDS